MTTEDRFIEIFELSKLSQSRFAQVIGVTQAEVSRLVNGRGKVPAKAVLGVLRAYNIDITSDLPTNFTLKEVDLWSGEEQAKKEQQEALRANFAKFVKNSDLTYRELANSLGYASGTTITDVISGKKRVTQALQMSVQINYGVNIAEDIPIISKNAPHVARKVLKRVINLTTCNHRKFADSLGVHESLISYILSGKKAITSTFAGKVKVVYNVDLWHDNIKDLEKKLRVVDKANFKATTPNGDVIIVNSVSDLLELGWVRISK